MVNPDFAMEFANDGLIFNVLKDHLCQLQFESSKNFESEVPQRKLLKNISESLSWAFQPREAKST